MVQWTPDTPPGIAQVAPHCRFASRSAFLPALTSVRLMAVPHTHLHTCVHTVRILHARCLGSPNVVL